MQSGKASGLRPPSKIARPSSISGSQGDLTASRSASPGVGTVLTENTDNFIVGNRVWVGGSKPGHIQYIGETKFAPGEWAGVVLDDPIGKNDGSVAGVRYFQCEPKKGVFSRLTKLTLEPLLHLMSNEVGTSADVKAGSRSTSPKPMSNSRITVPTPRSSTPLSDGPLHVGDRVNVVSASGTKTGTLRYLGTTDFAVGEWAGIELEEAVGKNDGSVNGKRYFTCTMKYGLFAPIAKVSKYRPSSARALTTTAAASPKRLLSTPRRTGSQESVNTIGSTSSAARSVSSKPRLGVTALTTASKPSRVGPSIAATHTAMQGALKEKEQHIEQLLREREMEMADVAKTSSQLEDSERKLGVVRSEYQRFKEDVELRISKLNELVETKEKENNSLINQIDEERRKNEELQFRLDEEASMKSELENAKDDESRELKLLQEKYETERAKVERLERESQINFQNEEALVKYADDVETLERKLKNSEEINRNLESRILTASSRSDETDEELQRRSKRIDELSEVNDRLLSEIKQREEESEQSKMEIVQKYDIIVNEFKSNLTSVEQNIAQLNKQLSESQVERLDLEKKLQLSEEKSMQQKMKFENEISEQLKYSGDNSAQLSRLNEQLREREKSLDESQSLCCKLEEEIKRILNQNKAEIESLEIKHKADLEKQLLEEGEKWNSKLENNKQGMENEISRLKSELEQNLGETKKVMSEFEEEKKRADEAKKLNEDLIGSAERGLEDVRIELNKIHKEKQELLQLIASLEQANKQFSTEVEHLKAEKESQNEEIKLKDKMLESIPSMEIANKQLTNEVEMLRVERESQNAEIKLKDKILESIPSMEIANKQLANEVEMLRVERDSQNAEIKLREEKMLTLTGETEKLKEAFANHQIELQQKLEEAKLDNITVQNLKNHIEMQQKKLEEFQKDYDESENKVNKFSEENSRIPALLEEVKQVQLKLEAAEMKLAEAEGKEKQMLKDFKSEKETAQNLAETAKILLDQHSAESLRQQNEITALKQDIAKRDLQLEEALRENARLSQLEKKSLVTNGNSAETKLIEEKEALESQVDFLNSVIVDMQKKVEDYQTKLQVMVVGGNGHLDRGSDVNLNAIKIPIAPRMFCDICDVFDAHETEDCPLQASSADSPPPTQYHGIRNQDRPYCDICEVFGHWTNECDDNETF